MTGTFEVLVVVGLFIVRIGIPLTILLAVGSLIERGYSRRETSNIR